MMHIHGWADEEWWARPWWRRLTYHFHHVSLMHVGKGHHWLKPISMARDEGRPWWWNIPCDSLSVYLFGWRLLLDSDND